MENVIHPNTIKLFEYHCNESHDSTDAELWYHSHQRAMVLQLDPDSEPFHEDTPEQRAEFGNPLVYRIVFADGFTSAAFEDELMDSQTEFVRPDPPLPVKAAN